MTNYARGTAFEMKCAAYLAERGWFVIRSAGSHGLADVVAIAPAAVVFVQCKATGTIRGSEWNRLWEAAQAVNTLPVLAQYGHKPSGEILWLQLTGIHQESSREWPWQPWNPTELAATGTNARTAAKAAELELERLQRPPGRMP